MEEDEDENVERTRTRTRTTEDVTAAVAELQKAVLRSRVEEFKKRWGFDVLNEKPTDSGDWVYTRLV